MDRLPRKEKREKKSDPERAETFSYDAGVEEIARRAQELLGKQRYVAIGIAGPLHNDTNVGKTTTSANIKKRLYDEGIHAFSTSRPKNIADIESWPWRDKTQVFVFNATNSCGPMEPDLARSFKESSDRGVKKYAEAAGYPLEGVDIRVLLCRPDQQPDEGEYYFNDIVIENEYAVDKP